MFHNEPEALQERVVARTGAAESFQRRGEEASKGKCSIPEGKCWKLLRAALQPRTRCFISLIIKADRRP